MAQQAMHKAKRAAAIKTTMTATAKHATARHKEASKAASSSKLQSTSKHEQQVTG